MTKRAQLREEELNSYIDDIGDKHGIKTSRLFTLYIEFSFIFDMWKHRLKINILLSLKFICFNFKKNVLFRKNNPRNGCDAEEASPPFGKTP